MALLSPLEANSGRHAAAADGAGHKRGRAHAKTEPGGCAVRVLSARLMHYETTPHVIACRVAAVKLQRLARSSRQTQYLLQSALRLLRRETLQRRAITRPTAPLDGRGGRNGNRKWEQGVEEMQQNGCCAERTAARFC